MEFPDYFKPTTRKVTIGKGVVTWQASQKYYTVRLFYEFELRMSYVCVTEKMSIKKASEFIYILQQLFQYPNSAAKLLPRKPTFENTRKTRHEPMSPKRKKIKALMDKGMTEETATKIYGILNPE